MTPWLLYLISFRGNLLIIFGVFIHVNETRGRRLIWSVHQQLSDRAHSCVLGSYFGKSRDRR